MGEDQFQISTILSSMVEGVLVVDLEGKIRLANRSFLEMFSIRGDVQGGDIDEVLVHDSMLREVHKAIRSGKRRQKEVLITEEKGEGVESRIFDMNSAPVYDDAGVFTGVVVAFHDITRLNQLEDVRQEFVANVSHELKTPLSIFQGYLETILGNECFDFKDCRKVLEVLQRHSYRLNLLVDDLLTLARLESGGIQLNPVMLNVETLFEMLQEDWSMRENLNGCELSVRIGEGVDVVEGDQVRVEQVFYNLLENSFKYSEPGGKVELGVDLGDDQEEVLFYVKDEGVGIPDDKLPHIFERFYRVDKARSREMGGTGLGLSIVKHIIQLHGGRVWADSKVRKGTTIWFSLPALGE